MLSFAIDVRDVVHKLGFMDKVAAEIPSAQSSSLAQNATVKGASILYNVMIKKAEAEGQNALPRHAQVVMLVNKVASVLGRPLLSPDANLEIASAVVADDALSEVMKTASDNKLAEAQSFGREFFVELLRKAL